MNGYQSQIFERHDKPGGLCTAWRRKDYLFDGCLHNLAGTGQKSRLRQVWEELGAFTGREIIDYEEFIRVEGPEGQALRVYADLDRLEQHLLAIAPRTAG